MLRLSFPQKASRRGGSPPTSSPAAGLRSGDPGPRLRSGGVLVETGVSSGGEEGSRPEVAGGKKM